MINKKIIIAITTACLFIIVFGCKEKVVYTGQLEGSQKYNFLSFIKNIKTFPYEATTEKRKRVMEGFSKLSVGMNKEQVIELLGEPDGESFDYDTTKVKTYVGSSWGYYLRLHEAERSKEQYDQAVHLYFDRDEKLYWVNPHNINSLKDKGGPNLRKR